MNNLSALYSNHNLENRGRGFVIFEKERSEFIKKFIPQKIKILDLGCRDGALTRYANRNNNVIGCDIDTDALKYAQENYGITPCLMDINGDWKEIKGSFFDAIFLFEILEHLYFPENILKKINLHMKKNAILIGSIPNGFSLPKRIRLFLGNKKGTTLDDPTHINHFLYKEIKYLLEKYFKDVEIFPLVDKKWFWLAKIFPGLFSFMFLFKCKKR